MKVCKEDRCNNEAVAKGQCKQHYLAAYQRANKGRQPTYHRQSNGSGYIDKTGYRIISVDGEQIREHIYIVERLLGRKLQGQEEVHHVNEIVADNANHNLVVCPTREYHKWLHRRTQSLMASGHVDWRKCKICKQWDAPERLRLHPKAAAVHVACQRQYAIALWRRRKAEEEVNGNEKF
jgi:hypothetical protein